jgi:hypothetical protein
MFIIEKYAKHATINRVCCLHFNPEYAGYTLLGNICKLLPHIQHHIPESGALD